MDKWISAQRKKKGMVDMRSIVLEVPDFGTYVCIHLSIYICLSIYIYPCMSIYLHLSMYVCMHASIYLSTTYLSIQLSNIQVTHLNPHAESSVVKLDLSQFQIDSLKKVAEEVGG